MTKSIFLLILILITDLLSSQINPCANEDFENLNSGIITNTAQVPGWLFANKNNSVITTCYTICDSLELPIDAEIISTNSNGYLDHLIGAGYPIYSVYGSSNQNQGTNYNAKYNSMYGNNFLKLGSYTTTNSINQLTKVFKVDSLNWYFKYSYIYVFQARPNHNHTTCCYPPMLKIQFTNLSTNTVSNFHTKHIYSPQAWPMCSTPQNPQDTFYVGQSNGNIYPGPIPMWPWPVYSKWNEIVYDLSTSIGDSIKIDFIAKRCFEGFCSSYAYIDAQCFSGNIYANNVLNTSGAYTSCANVTLSTVPGYTYSWNGPNLNNVSTQSIVINTSGNYSLNIYSNQNLISIQTISVTINTPLPIQINTTCDTICKNASCLLTISPNMSPYQWNTGSTTYSTLVTPPNTTFYYVIATDSNGCKTLGHKTIVVEECTGLFDLNNDTYFKVYPNPTENKIFLESKNGLINSVIITDLLGRAIPVKIGQDKIKEIDLTNLPKGVYFIKAKIENETKTLKIIRN